jgi:LPS-assembly protein
MARFLAASALFLAIIGIAANADAQFNIAGFDRVAAFKQEQLGEHHFLLSGSVELEKGDTSVYADSVEYFQDDDRVIAIGNVVVTQGTNRIAADKADFNTETQLGTFFHAAGIATVRQGRQRGATGGIAVPQPVSLDNDVYYFGEVVEKIGVKKYKITNGGFSTCVQPTPRWDLSATTIVLNIDHYTLMKNALLNVKGVPLLYLPIMYYPTKDEERATGFLIPTYGVSTVRGQAIHNAFFWAISRSQDATFLADWFSKVGTGTGAEYRYNRGNGSDGQISGYLLNQHAADYLQPDGTTLTEPASRSYTFRGSANQTLPHRFRLRAKIDYFSSILTNQTFNTNIYDAASNQRDYAVNLVGAVGNYSINGTIDRTEWFNTTTSSSVVGDSPRLAITRTDRPLFGQLYFGASGEFAHLDRLTLDTGSIVDGGNRSLSRLDFAPQLRFPFKRWPFFTVNTTLQWRETFYTRSQDPVTQEMVDTSLNRQYVTVMAQFLGPVFTRIWNTPDSRIAEKFKHTIEPYVNLQRTSAINNYDSIVKIDGIDQVVGSTTSVSYGVNNRLYAKQKQKGAQISQSREILSLGIGQTYYSDAQASQVDPTYITSTTTTTPSKFSPIAANLQATPTQTVNTTVQAEVDSTYLKLRTLSINSTINLRQQLQTTVGYSRNFYIPEVAGFNDKTTLAHALNVATNLQTRDRRYGALYSFNYDLLQGAMLQQRITGFYNAQCCGIAFEYQRYNFAGLPSYVVPADTRFFLSFTLAGLGNFSPFSGGLGGAPH